MGRPVLVTGCGVISAIGLDKASTLESLKTGSSGVRNRRYLHSSHDEFPVGEVQLSNAELCALVGIDENDFIPRTTLLGIAAIREALDEAGLLGCDLSDAVLVSGTTVGGMDKTEGCYPNFSSEENFNPCIRTHGCGATTEMMAEHFGGFRRCSTISTACSSAANAILEGARLIRLGLADIAVVGGSESLSRFHLNGFNSLMILDREPCRPFDSTRAGLNLGEGSAFVVLESESSASRRGARPVGYISGCANACDAFHQTASSADGEGAFLAMTSALRDAGLSPSDIDYVNAHGTGTPNNDLSESAALARVFGERMPYVSSTKSYTGHTTSASGSIETVISLLAINAGLVPGGLRCASPDPGCVLQLSSNVNTRVDHVMCNSFGFGGNDSSIIISSVDAVAATESKQDSIVSEKPVYIRSTAAISCQKPLSDEFLTEPIIPEGDLVRSVDPEWKPFFTPMEGRRLGKILKRALATSLTALREAGLTYPDGIITGTGMGCIDNSEVFLKGLCEQGESCSMPTYFMQSTHNTIGSTIGIKTKCHGYNTTISHQFISFELSMQDALEQFMGGFCGNILVGAFDEITDTFANALKGGSALQGLDVPLGEAAASFVVTDSSEDSLCRIGGVWTCYSPTQPDIDTAISSMLDKCGLSTVDYVLYGSDNVDLSCLGNVRKENFKKIFCESMSSSSLAFHKAALMIAKGECRSMVIVNDTFGKDVSISLLVK